MLHLSFIFYCLHFGTEHTCVVVASPCGSGTAYPRSRHNVRNKETHLLLPWASAFMLLREVLGVGVLMHASVSCHVTMSRGALTRRRAVSMV